MIPLKIQTDSESKKVIKIEFANPIRAKLYFRFRDFKIWLKKTLRIKSKGRTILEMQEHSAELLRQWKIDRVKAPESLKYIIQQGWYLPHYVNEATINHIADEYKSGNTEAEHFIMNILDKHSKAELETLITRFPNRASAIIAAFDAHVRGEYYLSVPVFFAQTEGICNEVIGSRFFSTEYGTPKTKSWASALEQDEFINLILKPLIEVGEVRRKQVIGNPSGANRHDVLHGDSTDYGTEVNSYKAFSLLTYIGITVYELDEWLSVKAARQAQQKTV